MSRNIPYKNRSGETNTDRKRSMSFERDAGRQTMKYVEYGIKMSK